MGLEPSGYSDEIPCLPADVGAEPGADLSRLLLDELNCGVLMVDRRGSIVHSNRAARNELARARVLGEVAGNLYALAATDGKTLQIALNRAAMGRRGLVKLQACGEELSLMLVPLGGPRALPGSRRIALYLQRREVCDQELMRLYGTLYQLTEAEVQVLSLLMQGGSTPQVAERLAVAVSTVRTHVRNLSTKTRTSGIRELVARLSMLPPVSATPAIVNPMPKRAAHAPMLESAAAP